MLNSPFRYEASDVFPCRILSIRPELYIIMSAGTFTDKTKINTATTSPMFELSYTRKGSVFGEVDNTLVELQPGHALVGFMGSVCSHAEYNRGENVHTYSIWASPRAFNGFCESVSGRSDTFFQDFQSKNYVCHHCRIDVREESILRKLDGCLSGERNTINRLLIESSVLELLSINLERLLCEGCRRDAIGLSRTEVDSLKLAREILLNRLESPPSLLELSRLVHLNDCKLKRTFKLLFGKTVYGYVREQRLEKAFYLLESGKCNVSEAAFTIGYTNISHFSEAFQKKYGVLPREVKKRCHTIY